MHTKTKAHLGGQQPTIRLVKPLRLRDVTNRSAAANSARRRGMIAAAADLASSPPPSRFPSTPAASPPSP